MGHVILGQWWQMSTGRWNMEASLCIQQAKMRQMASWGCCTNAIPWVLSWSKLEVFLATEKFQFWTLSLKQFMKGPQFSLVQRMTLRMSCNSLPNTRFRKSQHETILAMHTESWKFEVMYEDWISFTKYLSNLYFNLRIFRDWKKILKCANTSCPTIGTTLYFLTKMLTVF